MNGWIACFVILAAAVVTFFVIALIEETTDPWLNADRAAGDDDGQPVEVDCTSCHGTGVNESLTLGWGSYDRTCGDCDGTGVTVVWEVDCPACDGTGMVYVGREWETNEPLDDWCGMCAGTGAVDAERVA